MSGMIFVGIQHSGLYYTEKKKIKFSSGNSDGRGCEVIFEEGLPNI
jgi:hypothetical protein